MLHELWDEGEGEQLFCLAGPHGDDARALLAPGARIVWTVEANSHVEAMTKYYEYMVWGTYTTVHFDIDSQTYSEWGFE